MTLFSAWLVWVASIALAGLLAASTVATIPVVRLGAGWARGLAVVRCIPDRAAWPGPGLAHGPGRVANFLPRFPDLDRETWLDDPLRATGDRRGERFCSRWRA